MNVELLGRIVGIHKEVSDEIVKVREAMNKAAGDADQNSYDANNRLGFKLIDASLSLEAAATHMSAYLDVVGELTDEE